MIKIIPKFLLVFFAAFFITHLCAQEVNRQELIERYAAEYMQTTGRYAAIYYGYQQMPLPSPTTNNPYLNSALFANGRLSYNKILYPDVLLKFDLYRNELIIISPDVRDIVLFPENVDYADLHGKHIVYFRYNSLPGCPSTGYYFSIHSGKCKVLEKQTATLLRSTSGSISIQNVQYYDFKRTFYLFKDGVYYKVNNQKSLLKLLSPYQKELKQYISSLKMKYKHFPDVVLALTVSEYEKLSGL